MKSEFGEASGLSAIIRAEESLSEPTYRTAMDGSAPPRLEGRCRFGVFEFDGRTLELWKNGRPVSLRPQPLRLLALLIARPGDLVSRQDIQRVLWSDDTFVDFDQGMNHSIRELRAALGDDAEAPRFIQTLPKRGYRFVAPLNSVIATEVPSAVVSIDTPAPLESVSTVRTSPPRATWKWIAAGGLATVLIATVVVSLAWRSNAGTRPAMAMVLAVQPFSTSASDRMDGVGLANAITTRLGGQQMLPVRRLNAGQASAAERPADITHIVGGDITQSGNDVTVLARLDDVAAGTTLWSQRIHVRADELFSVESVIADRVVDALRLRLAAAEQERLLRRYTSNSAAYQLYLRGRAALVEYTPDGTRRAVQAFEQALERDPCVHARTCGAGDGERRHVSTLRTGGRSGRVGSACGDRSTRGAGTGPGSGGSASGPRRSCAKTRVRLEHDDRGQPPCPGAQPEPRTGAPVHGRRLLPPRVHGRSAHCDGEGPATSRPRRRRASAHRSARGTVQRPLRAGSGSTSRK